MHVREAGADDAAAIARVTVDTWKTAYRGIIHDHYLDHLTYADREKGWREFPFHNSFIFVAEDDLKQIIGFAAAGPERDSPLRYEGELYAIYIDPEQQNKGVGSALFQSVAKRFLKSGISSLFLWVLAENPYRRFYEHMGGQPLASKIFSLDNADYEITAYGWDDLNSLLFK